MTLTVPPTRNGTLLLATTGRRSGIPHRTCLIYGTAGEDFVVVASKGGADDDPAWFARFESDDCGEDWTARATPASVHRTVTRGLDGGGTILLHDSDCTSAPGAWCSARGALPRILDTCEERGLSVGPLREHGRYGGGAAPVL